MKILAIGDFHGKFQNKFAGIIKKEKIDIVVSVGDYCPFHYRDLWFKHCYRKDISLWEVIGKNKYKDLVLKDIKSGEKVLKKLNNLSIPVITVVGNLDYSNISDSYDVKKPRGKRYWAFKWQDFFSKILKKYNNIKRFDYSYIKFNGFVFIGSHGSSNRGKVKSKAYKKHRKILNNLFNKFNKENKAGKVIFVSHNVPYNTKLDKASPFAHEKVRKMHIGSKLVRRIIDRHQPILSIAGHIHESIGKQKLNKTLVINPGAAHEGKAAIISINDNNPKEIKVKFVR